MSSVLFGSTARTSSKHLVEFRAGKMYKQDKMVRPDKRKGLIYVYQADDSLMHFCWKDRSTGTLEEDLIIFPDDVVFKKVKNCNNGRVFVLRFKSNNRLFFFWMQEPKSDKDDEYCTKVNEYLNNPPTPGSQRSSNSTPALSSSDLSNLPSSELSNIIGDISQQQLVQLLGSGMPNLASLLTTPDAAGGGSSGGSATTSSGSSSTTTTSSLATTSSTASSATTTTSNTATTPTSSSGIQLSDLQSILNGMSVPNTPRSQVPVDLSSVMTAEALKPILSNEEFVEQLKPFLPDTGKDLPSAELLRGTVTSPQFQQAVSLFTAALQSGELGPLIGQFGLGEDAVLAATCSDMEAFIKALSKKEDGKDKPKEASGKDQDKDEDDSMVLD